MKSARDIIAASVRSRDRILGVSPANRRRAVSGRRKLRVAAAAMCETLEERRLLTVVFNTAYGAEALTHSAPFGALNSPTVHLLLWGTGWGTGPGQTDPTLALGEAQATLNSTYLNGLTEYGSDGRVGTVDTYVDSASNPPSNFNPGNLGDGHSLGQATAEIQAMINTNNIAGPGSLGLDAIYFIITDPTHSGGTNGGYNTQTPVLVPQPPFGNPGFDFVSLCSIGTKTVGDISNAFGHEMAERMSDPGSYGVTLNEPLPQAVASLNGGNGQGVQIGDGEAAPASQSHYYYRLGGPSAAGTVQPYYSVNYRAFIVTDGNSQRFDLAPIWTPGASNNDTFTGQYNLTVNGDQLGNLNDTITIGQSSSGGVQVTLNGETVSFDQGQINSVTINSGGGQDFITVLSTVVPTTINSSSAPGGPDDNVVVGNRGNTQGIAAPLTITNATGYDVVGISDSTDTVGQTVTVSAHTAPQYLLGVFIGNETFEDVAGIGGNPSATISCDTTHTRSLTVNTGTGGNTIDVFTTLVPTTISGFANSPITKDNINVGLGSNTQLFILSPLTIQENNPLECGITIDDSLDGTISNVSLQNAATAGFGTITGISQGVIDYQYASTSRLIVKTGTAVPTVNVLATGTATNLLTNYASSSSTGTSVVVGNGGSVQGIAGLLKIANLTGAPMQITVDDSNDSASHTVALHNAGTPDYGAITGLVPDPAEIDYRYAGTSSFNVLLGTASNTVDVQTTGAPTVVRGNTQNGRGNTVNVGNPNNSQGLLAGLTLSDPPGFDDITIDDSGDSGARAVVLSNSSTAASGTITGLAQGSVPITYTYNDTNSLTINLGTGGNTVNVHSTGATTTFLGGNARTFQMDGGATATLSGITVNGGSGGGITNHGNMTVTNSFITGNTGGGGIANYGALTLKQSTVSNNSTTGSGGGIESLSGGSLTISDSAILNNTAVTSGGGIYDSSGTTSIIRTGINGNSASGQGAEGGGLLLLSASPTLINCVIYGNTAAFGSALDNVVGARPILVNCTIAGNTLTGAATGGTIYSDSTSVATLTNCIVWDNLPSNGAEIRSFASAPSVVSYSDVAGTYANGTYPGTANINTDPMFVGNVSLAPLYLQGTSPCINKGNNQILSTYNITTDVASLTRILPAVGGTVDMGAYEYNGSVNLALIQGPPQGGVTLPSTLTVVVSPEQNNVVIKDGSTVTLKLYKNSTLKETLTSVVNGNGQATFANISFSGSGFGTGAYSFTATDGSDTPLSLSFSVNAAGLPRLFFASPFPATVPYGQPTIPLTVDITDSAGNPLKVNDTVAVTFNSSSYTTQAQNGVATFSLTTPPPSSTPYPVEADDLNYASGAVAVSSFITVSQAALTLIQGPPQGGVTLPNLLTMIISPELNGVVIKDGSTVSLHIYKNSSLVDTTISTVNSNGQATFNLFLGGNPFGPGAYTFTATDGSDTSLSGNFTVNPAGLPKLVFAQPFPSTVPAGQATISLTVDITDSAGNPLSVNDPLAVVFNGGVYSAQAQTGMATFILLTPPPSSTPYTVEADDTNYPSGAVAVTSSITVTPVVHANVLTFGGVSPTQPQTAGTPITGITVTVTNNGTPVTNDPVTLSLISPVGATLPGNPSATTNSNGVASFGGITLSPAGLYTLQAIDSSGVTTNVTFSVTTPVLTTLVFDPANPIADYTLGVHVPTFQVFVEQNGVIIDDNSLIDISAAIPNRDPIGGTWDVNAVHGVATFNNLYLGKAAPTTLRATDLTNPGDVPAVSNSFAVNPGPTTYFSVTTTGNATAGASAIVTVNAQDGTRNFTPGYTGDVTLTITDALGNVVATPTVTAVGGIATFGNIVLDQAGNYYLTATGTGAGGSGSGGLTVVNATPSRLALLQQPGTTAANFPFAPPVSVAVEDAFGNVVTTDNNTQVSLFIAGGPGGASLNGATTVQVKDGVATFSTANINQAGTSYILGASDDAGDTIATSNSFNIISPATIYVDQQATQGNNGQDWPDAFTSLQSALAVAVPGDTIDVAQGDYLPGTDPTATFQLIEGITIQGGFATGGVSGPNPAAYPTVLDGVGSNYNSYHVVTSIGGSAMTVLRGFTITGGNANGTGDANSGFGGGMIVDGGSLGVSNCIFNANSAVSGGGIYVYAGAAVALNDVTISGNLTSYSGATTPNGGGLAIAGSATVNVTNSTFNANTAALNGGGVYEDPTGTLTLLNCTFTGNIGGGIGGAIEGEGSLVVINSTLNANTAGIGGGIASAGSLLIMDSTISGNAASNGAAGLYSFGSGAGVVDGTILVGNTAYGSTPDDMDGNAVTGSFDLIGVDYTGSFTTGVNNNTVGVTSDQLLLAPLADNGGPTQTMALLSGSPAIGAGFIFNGPDSIPISLDQRGILRPANAPDIGAYQTQAVLPALPAWLDPASVATWDGNTHTLSVTGPAIIIADPGTDDPTIVDSNTGTIEINGGITVTNIGPISGTGSLLIDAGASLTAASITQTSLTVNGSLTMLDKAHGGGQIELGSVDASGNTTTAGVLTIARDGSNNFTGKIDLADRLMMIHYTQDSTAPALSDGPADYIDAALAQGRNVAPGGVFDGPWTGSGGIVSSTAAQSFLDARNATGSPNTEFYAVGYGDTGKMTLSDGTITNKMLIDDAGPSFFDPAANGGRGAGIGSTVFLRYTRVGDATMDGIVGNNDVTVLGLNFDPTYIPAVSGPRHWYDGNFNYNGIVDNNDVTILGLQFDPTNTTAVPTVLQAAATPSLSVGSNTVVSAIKRVPLASSVAGQQTAAAFSVVPIAGGFDNGGATALDSRKAMRMSLLQEFEGTILA